MKKREVYDLLLSKAREADLLIPHHVFNDFIEMHVYGWINSFRFHEESLQVGDDNEIQFSICYKDIKEIIAKVYNENTLIVKFIFGENGRNNFLYELERKGGNRWD